MILIRRKATGELAAVESLDGYDRRSWESLGEIPEGVDPMLAVLEAGAIANNLDVARALRLVDLKRRYAAAAGAGCSSPRGLLQSNAATEAKLASYAMQAIAQGEAFVPIAFTMADNTVQIHDGQAIVAAHLAVARYSAACHDRYEQLRAELGAAADLSAVGAVNFDQGWPGETPA